MPLLTCAVALCLAASGWAQSPVSGTITLSATANDNVGVTGVAFRVDGRTIGPEVVDPPYTINYDTTFEDDGTHTVTAVARDRAGNVTISAPVTILIRNSQPARTTIDAMTYGAARNGSTDDTAALQRAIDATPSGGTLVIAGPGTFRVAGTLNLRAGRWYQCTGGAVLLGTPDTYQASLDGGGNLRIDGCVFDSAGIVAASPTPTSKVRISNNTFRNINGKVTPFAINNSTGGFADSYVFKNTFYNIIPGSASTIGYSDYPGVAAIFTFNGANFWITDNSFDTVHEGVYQKWTRAGTYPGNLLANNTGTRIHRMHIEMQTDANAVPAGMIVELNSSGNWLSPFYNTFGYSMATAGATNLILRHNLTVADNVGPTPATFCGGTCSWYGIGYEPWGSGTLMEGNILKATGPLPQGQWSVGIGVGYCPNCKFVNNDTCGVGQINTGWFGLGFGYEGPFSWSANPQAGIQFCTDRSNPASCTSTWTQVSNPVITTGCAASADQTPPTVVLSAPGGSTTPPVDTIPPTAAITAPAPDTTVSGTVVITATASDNVGVTEVRFQLDGTTVIGRSSASPYSVSLDTTTLSNAYHTVAAIARDAAGNESAPATVRILVNNPVPPPQPPIPVDGLRLWLRADAGISLNGQGISRWADQSSYHSDATQNTSANQPALVASGPAGRPTVRFDGATDWLNVSLPINGLSGMTMFLVSSASADRNGGASRAESAALFWDETASWGTTYLSPFQTNVKFRFGTTQVNNWPSYTRPSPLIGASVTTSIKNGTTDSLYVNGALAMSESGKLAAINGTVDTAFVGRGYNNTYFPGDISEVIVYNRALSDAERQAVEAVLLAKYSVIVPDTTIPAAAISSPAAGAFVTGKVTVTASASDPAGIHDVRFLVDGTVQFGSVTATPYSATLDTMTLKDGSHTITAIATDNAGNASAPVAVTVQVGNYSPDATLTALPASGLRLWLRADTGITLNGSNVALWADRSPNHADAGQAKAAGQPAWLAAGAAGRPAVSFDGLTDWLNVNLPINGLNGMTILLVSTARADRNGGSSRAESAALFWDETAWWGTTYIGPFQTNVKFRFGTTQTNNWPSYTRPSPVTGVSITTTVKNGTTDSLYVNGALALKEGGKLAAIKGTVNTAYLGRGYNSTYFPGDISEVIVYSRALTDAERQAIEAYLSRRYLGR